MCGEGFILTQVDAMDMRKDDARPRANRAKPIVSRTRVIMILMLAVAVPIFISLANKAVSENSVAIHDMLTR